MFIQFIQARCTRRDELRSLADQWRTELAEGAAGWLGGTFGFTDDGQFLGVVRFESRDAAMANSARPEQTAWAQRMAEVMDGPTEFHDSDDVTTVLDGGSDHAGFVQVVRGHTDDPTGLKSFLTDTADGLRAMRPEVVGGTFALEPDGTFTETIAFTDEDAARKGEQVEPPPEVAEQLRSMLDGATFYDLHEPWFESP